MNPDATPAAAPEKAGPSNLRLRVIYGVLGAALLLGCVWYGPVTFGLFFALVQAIMLKEFYRIMRAAGYAPATWIGVLVGTLLFGSLALLGINKDVDTREAASFIFPISILLVFLLLPIVLLLREMLLWPKQKHPFVNVGVAVLGLFYVSLPMSMLNSIAFGKYTNYDYRRIFALLFLVWASDIGAYAAGKTFGKHKLAPKISPGKTWEGWAGGFLLTLLVGWALKFMLPDVPLAHLLVAAAVVAIFGPLGDLAESMLKRSAGVKDSGTFLPGHGGLLDRFDAFLLVLPVLALLQLLAR